MITEDYVSFEIARLLKEKGFDEECRAFYVKSKECGIELFHAKEPYNYNNNVHPCTSAPTLQMAMKWLQEALNILVIPNYEYECDDTPWCYKIFTLEEGGKPERVAIKGVSYDKDNNPTEHIVGYRDYERSYDDYSTKEEACETAIKYCLENLA